MTSSGLILAAIGAAATGGRADAATPAFADGQAAPPTGRAVPAAGDRTVPPVAPGASGPGRTAVAAEAGTTPQSVAAEARRGPPGVGADEAGDDPDADPEQLLALFPDARGQSTNSMDELDLVLGQRQIFSDLRSLQDRILGDQRPTANAVVRHSTQSDHLDINQAELSQDLYFAQGRTQLRLGFQAVDYHPRDGSGVRQYAVGGNGNQRISDVAAFTGEFWLNHLETRGTSDVTPTYDAFLTLRPSDAIRIDLDTSRRLFDNVTSLQLGLSVTTFGGSIDFTPMDGLRLTARGSYGSYSDGNGRRNAVLEGIWRVRTRPVVVEVGLRATDFHFNRLYANGYFNPRDYVSGEAMFRVQAPLSARLTGELAGSGGIEHADPGGDKPLVKGSLQLAYKLTRTWSLDAEIAHFSSRQSTTSGFSRTSATLGLHYRF